MANFYPSLMIINSLKQKPTNGEYRALEVLKELPGDYEVYYQPYINGHNPDIVILRKDYGVLVIEVKDWNLESYNIDNNDNWSLRYDGTRIKSPLKQVKAYKDDLYNLSIPHLLEKKIKENKIYGLVKVAVYFHNETSQTIKKDIKTDKWCPVYGYNNLTLENIYKYSFPKYKSKFFDDELYREFQRVLKPSFHTLEQAQEVVLSPRQKSLAQSKAKQQKIRGVAGSGKTVVLAKRAVNSHIRHGESVLILTYNITLRNYIHDSINRVRENFDWKIFHINHYHGFMMAEANNHNIEIVDGLKEFDNENIFEKVKDKINKYQAIFIDEIQDYKKSWIRIIKKYFLAKNGEFVVFGDEKQNIYNIELEQDKKPYTGVPGPTWQKLEQSYRLSNKILNLAEAFQSHFFKDKYELDKAIPKQQTFDFEEEIVEYYNFDDKTTLETLSSFIIDKIKKDSIQNQDVCILAQSNGLLKELDYDIRKSLNQKTYTTFEIQEIVDLLKSKKLSEKDFEGKIRTIRKNKRFNFWMNSAGLKLSTINSFKGWEIHTLFLIIDGESKHETSEKIYTAITRCRSRLVILNLNHKEYDDFFRKNMKHNDKIIAKENVEIKNDIEIIQPQVLQQEKKPSSKKTIREIINEEKKSDFYYNFIQLKQNSKFMILILGEISGDKSKFQAELNNHFSKHKIKSYEWDIEIWDNRKLKNKGIKSLRKGQSKYNLVITAQIYYHSSRDNKEQNLLMELISGQQYINSKIGCKPQKLLTVDNFIKAVDEYINENTF